MRLYRSYVCAPLDHFTNAANSKRMISRCRVRPANWPQPKRTLGLSHLLQRRCMRSRCTIPAYFVVYFLGCILDHQAVATRTPGNHAHLIANNWCPMCMLLVVRRVPHYKPQFFRMKGPADTLRRAGSGSDMFATKRCPQSRRFGERYKRCPNNHRRELGGGSCCVRFNFHWFLIVF